jgi:hypothetical protein
MSKSNACDHNLTLTTEHFSTLYGSEPQKQVFNYWYM